MSTITHRDLAVPSIKPRPFSAPGWIFELKYDGFRTLAVHDAAGARIVSRRGTDMTAAFPEIAACLVDLPHIVLDGELVLLDANGRPQFEPLRRRLALKRRLMVDDAARREPAALFAFDLLELEGRDLRARPLLERKAALERVLPVSARIVYAQHVGENGERLYADVERLGLEGIVGKRADSPYRRGRTSDWVKVKTAHGRAIDAARSVWNRSKP